MTFNHSQSIKLITKLFRQRPERDSTNRSFAVGKRKKGCTSKILGGVYHVVSTQTQTQTQTQTHENENYDDVPLESSLRYTVDMKQKQQIRETSSRTLSTIVDSASHESEAGGSKNDDGSDDDDTSDGDTSNCSSKNFQQQQQQIDNSDWISSESPSHHDGAPLLAKSQRNLFERKSKKQSLALSDEEIIGRIMLRARKLPKLNPRYLISNHIMINNERTKRTRVPLQRSPALDEIARSHAIRMANQQQLFHPSLDNVVKNYRRRTNSTPSNPSAVHPKQTLSLLSGTWQGINQTNSPSGQRRDDVIISLGKNNSSRDNYDNHNNHTQRQVRRTRLGVNVGCGSNVNDIHKAMKTSKSDLNNITDRRFVYMGIGTSEATDGVMYLCQIFGD